MSKKILFKSEEYPTRFGMSVYKKWELEEGLKFTDLATIFDNEKEIGLSEMVIILSMGYFGIKSGCNKEGIEFNYTMEDFLDEISSEEVKGVIEAVTLGVAAYFNAEKVENKGLPKTKKR